MLIAALLLLVLFTVPLWKITLEAPQYPDGISMYIWINKITGDTDYTLQNINILNHYVGMKYIEPDSIPELKYFPKVIAILIFLGIIAAWASSKYIRLSWVVLVVILAGLGVYDFYLWEYDYGHNLSDTAPIKVPGMAYQPPLIGSKMLLNFKAASYPNWGALALVASIFLAFYSYWSERAKSSAVSLNKKRKVAAAATLFIAMGLIGCSNEPQPINYGYDACHYCKMTIVDARFGAEGITSKGKQYKFDAIECMLNHIQHTEKETAFRTYVVPFDTPNNLVESSNCKYLINSDISSPMGMYLTAHKTESSAIDHQKEYGGQVLAWNDLRVYFEKTSNN